MKYTLPTPLSTYHQGLSSCGGPSPALGWVWTLVCHSLACLSRSLGNILVPRPTFLPLLFTSTKLINISSVTLSCLLWPHAICNLVVCQWHLAVFSPVNQMWPQPSNSSEQGLKIDLGGSRSLMCTKKHQQVEGETGCRHLVDLGLSLCSVAHWVVTLGKSLYFLWPNWSSFNHTSKFPPENLVELHQMFMSGPINCDKRGGVTEHKRGSWWTRV